MRSRILDTGVSVVYEPDNCSPIVDIIIIHGLQGNPYKTWTCSAKPPSTLDSPATYQSVDRQESRKSLLRRFASRVHRRSSKKVGLPAETEQVSTKGNDTPAAPVFWPADLLPRGCPNSRILVFGYDSKVTKYTAGAVNQNSVLSHSKDLLFALRRNRTLNRPLICVAHSLGGIVVKEMLARSSSSKESDLKNIVESTAAVIFLGTPHRGSLDVAALGEVVRSVVSSLGMETTPAILNALGLKTTDLERAQEEFSRLWQHYDFRVKTFQEGLHLAKLGKKVVPDYSSLIGDHREHAETLQADHMGMCRYSGIDDPNYRKVGGEIDSIYHSIARLKSQKLPQGHRTRPESLLSAISSAKPSKVTNVSQLDSACLESLWFPAINTRHQSLERPAEQTGRWLFENESYQDWFNNRNQEQHLGLLWLKGKPGTGKSTLMKEAFRRAASGKARSDYRTAAFFFSAKGDELEHSPLGLFRSLLYQLLPGDGDNLRRFKDIWDDKDLAKRDVGSKKTSWQAVELTSFFESIFVKQTKKRTIIFVDALDECDSDKIRHMAYFWRRITRSAHVAGAYLSVCLSSRHFPSVTVGNCPEIITEEHNSHDVATYLDQRFQLGIATQEPHWKLLRDAILEKSAGVFLWVVLVVDDVLRNWDDGKDMQYLTRRVKNVPEALETLFSEMLSSLSPETRQVTVRFFQWVILAAKPLRLHEWHHIMAFIRQPAPASLREWRRSDHFTANDDQLERQIRSVSRGLVEVKKTKVDESADQGFEALSVYAGAGSLNFEHGDTRIVQVIHESVRDFFLSNDGFSVLDPGLGNHAIANGHLAIMATCLDYLNITELDALVQARARVARRERTRPRQGSLHDWGESSYSSGFSSRGHVRPDLIHDKGSVPHGKNSVMREEQAPTFEMMRSIPSFPDIDVVRWMETGQSSNGSVSLDLTASLSPTKLSNASQSQVLEDYPALLSYATFMLFIHARLAEQSRVDLSPVAERLKDKTTWTRWTILRENIPEGTELLEYVAQWRLSSWVAAISNGLKALDGSPAASPTQLCPESPSAVVGCGSQFSFTLADPQPDDGRGLPSHLGAQRINTPPRSDGDVPPPLPPPRYLPGVDVPIRPRSYDDRDPATRFAYPFEYDNASIQTNPFEGESPLQTFSSGPLLNRSYSREASPHRSGRRALRQRASITSFGSAGSFTGIDKSWMREFEFDQESGPLKKLKIEKKFFLCECCPKKPKKFDTFEELSVHEAEKQYECDFCGNRLQNQNEAERYTDSLHRKRYSWSYSNLVDHDAAFHDSSGGLKESDVCGFCGGEFPRSSDGQAADEDWVERVRHLQKAHRYMSHAHRGATGK
ncbi:hypothetical protein QQZ08_012025 [Neonectria magnoliae]|uniref:NACHT domain-containing protein n=1 Tax=Neonectria magnoliae TaxID=2732573 RepID=A0ABR1H5J0_9HYPO